MQDNKRVVRSCRLYVSTSITPFFFDQRKKSCRKIWWNGKSNCKFAVDKKRRTVGFRICIEERMVGSIGVSKNE